MRLDYLRYFDHLAEVLNYTRAAEDLFIAQPTLSVAIKRMEKELGIKLFQRSEGSTRIELTEMGKAYHEYVALALKDLDKGLRIAREIQGEMNSSVRVGTDLCHARQVLVTGVVRVSRKEPIRSAYHGYASLFARTASQIAHRAA